MKNKKKRIGDPIWTKNLHSPTTLYCIVIPFTNKEEFEFAIEPIKKTRNKIQKEEKTKWWVDGILIESDEYQKLLKKSQSIQILNELDEDVNIEW